jgi:hypothetical protein
MVHIVRSPRRDLDDIGQRFAQDGSDIGAH